MGPSFARFFCYFVNNVVTNELETVFGHFICQFVMEENPNNKRKVVYDQIGWLTVEVYCIITLLFVFIGTS